MKEACEIIKRITDQLSTKEFTLEEEIRSKLNIYKDIQKMRIAANNQIWMSKNKNKWRKKRGLPPMILTPEDKLYLDSIVGKYKVCIKGLEGHEKEILKQLGYLASTHPMWIDWLNNVKGIGPVAAGFIIGILYNKHFPSRSHLKQYLGLGTDNQGRAIVRKKGQSTKCNETLKNHFLYVIAPNLVMHNKGVYRARFEKAYKKYANKHPEYVRPNCISMDVGNTVVYKFTSSGNIKQVTELCEECKNGNPNKCKIGWYFRPKDKRYPFYLMRLARRDMLRLFVSHLWEVMYRLKNPGKLPPRPMHWRNKPLEDNEIVPPEGWKGNTEYLNMEDSIAYYNSNINRM